MKKLTKKQIILSIIFLLIIISGAIVICLKGFNFELKYQNAQKVQINIDKDFNISDINDISKEVFGKQNILTQYVEMFKDTVQITTTSISDDQVQQLVDKLNAKYRAEEVANSITNSTSENTTNNTTTENTSATLFSKDNITVKNVPHMQLRDIVEPIILNLAIAIAVTLVYVAVRYRKLGTVKVLISCLLCGIIIPEALVFAIIAITRIPMGTTTLPIILITYVLGITLFVTKKEKQLEEKLIETKE